MQVALSKERLSQGTCLRKSVMLVKGWWRQWEGSGNVSREADVTTSWHPVQFGDDFI